MEKIFIYILEHIVNMVCSIEKHTQNNTVIDTGAVDCYTNDGKNTHTKYE